MNKSVLGFVLGLIFSLIGIACAYLFWMIFILFGAFTPDSVKVVLTVFPFINLGMFVISLIGSFFCLKKPRIGGIIMFISAIISFVCFAAICIALKTFDLIIILFWVPTIIVLVAGMITYKKKQNNM